MRWIETTSSPVYNDILLNDILRKEQAVQVLQKWSRSLRVNRQIHLQLQ